jgi:hypothetical protein
MHELLSDLGKPPDNWDRAAVESRLRAWRPGD